jgi:hypothetical protein
MLCLNAPRIGVAVFLILTPLFVVAAIEATGPQDKRALKRDRPLETPVEWSIDAVPGPRKTAPPAMPTAGGFVSVQVNVDEFGDNILNDAANEPSIAVDPTAPNRMVIGWRQFDTINNSFRQGGWGYSNDGGRSWTFPGVLEPGVFRSDPVLDSDNDGTFYYYSLRGDFFCTCTAPRTAALVGKDRLRRSVGTRPGSPSTRPAAAAKETSMSPGALRAIRTSPTSSRVRPMAAPHGWIRFSSLHPGRVGARSP